MQPNKLRSAVVLRKFLTAVVADEMFPEGKLELRELISTVHAFRTLCEYGFRIGNIRVVEGALMFRDSALLDTSLGIHADWLLRIAPDMQMRFETFRVGGTASVIESFLEDKAYSDFADWKRNQLSFEGVNCSLVVDCESVMTGFADLLATLMFNNPTIDEVEKFLATVDIEVTEEITININGVLYDTIPLGGGVMLKECPESYDYIKVTAALFAMNQQINTINLVMDTESMLIAIEPA